MGKQSKIVCFVEQVYRFVIGSFIYWRTLICSGIIYGFVDASTVLMAFLSSAEPPHAEKKENLLHRKILSFIWSILFSIVLSGFLYIGNGKGAETTIFLWITITTIFVLYHVFLVTVIELVKEIDSPFPSGLLYARTLDHMLRNPTKCLYIIVLSGIAVFLGFYNLILFVFLVPSLYWWLLNKGMEKRIMGTTSVADAAQPNN